MTSDRTAIVGWALTLALLAPLAAALTSAADTLDAWRDPRLWRLLMDTALFAGFAACVGVLAGYLVGRSGLVWSILACVPLALPGSLLGSAWIVALGRTGPLGDWLTVFDWPVAAGAVGLRYTGMAALVFATQRTGAGPAAEVYTLKHAWWWLGIKPLAAPATAAFALLFILCGADHIMPSLFLIHTYGTQVLIQYNALQDLPGAAALATPMLLLAVCAVLVIGRYVRPQATSEHNSDEHASRWPAVAVLVVAVGVPLAAIIWRCGSWTLFIQSFGQLRPEAWHTARLALTGALLCTLLGWALAQQWLASHRQGRRSAAPLLLINLAAPPSMLALGMIGLCSHRPFVWVRDTDIPLIATYVIRFAPVAVLLLFVSGLKRPQLPATAARLYGVPWRSRILRVDWPAWRGALLGTTVLCGLLIATELEASLMLAPAGTGTVGVRLYTLIHTAPDQAVSAASLAVIVMLTPWIILVGWWLTRRPV